MKPGKMLFPQASPPLRLRFIWLMIGYLLVFVVVFLSITSQPIELSDFSHEDKLFHALAYFSLMAWFAQIYHDRFQRNMIALTFIVMGLLLEYVQSLSPVRVADPMDMLANSTGVALGLLLAHTALKNLLLNFETLLFGKPS